MKKILCFVLGLSLGLSLMAQTKVNDSTRVYDVVTDEDTFYLFSMPKPAITPRYHWAFEEGIKLQTYAPTDTVTVYGVAMTIRNDRAFPVYDTITSLKALLMRKTGITLQTSSLTQYGMERIDSVTFNRSHPRFCWFVYEYDKERMVVPCFELYFDTPKQINILSDSFYVGRFHSEPSLVFTPREAGGNYTTTLPGTLMYEGTNIYDDEDLSRFTPQNYSQHHFWGMYFPIIGFRCGAMPGYRLAAYGGDSAVVSWRNAELGTLYNLRLVGSNGTDTTFYTSDTSFTLTNLDPAVRYDVMLRRQCHLSTSNYDTTVSSTWLSYISLYNGVADTTGAGVDTTGTGAGVERAEADGLITLSPNPARDKVTVGLPPSAVGGRLSLCDLAGRELEACTVSATTVVLDVSSRAVGVYLVKLVAPGGTSTRRLVVE